MDALITGAASHGRTLDRAIELVVSTSDKKRFALSPDGQCIRAVQGHSTASVAISFAEKTRTWVYHGTAERFLESIRKDGLKPGERQYVHLSEDVQTATSVGQSAMANPWCSPSMPRPRTARVSSSFRRRMGFG